MQVACPSRTWGKRCLQYTCMSLIAASVDQILVNDALQVACPSRTWGKGCESGGHYGGAGTILSVGMLRKINSTALLE